MSGTLTWSEFLKDAIELKTLSEKFGDTWQLIQKDANEGNSFLSYCQKILIKSPKPSSSLELNEVDEYAEINVDDQSTSIESSEELINIEYHVIYSISYQVPVLYFKGYKNNGTMISLEDSWQIFLDSTYENEKNSKMLSILTQMDHPIYFRPYMALHPCKTSEILSKSPDSKNRIVTFISVMGPYVQLKLKSEFGMYFNK